MDNSVKSCMCDEVKKLERKTEFQQPVTEVNGSTLSATRNYLQERKIFDLFRFLLGHLIVNRPTDPIEYLHQLLDDCILFRSGNKHPRLFWMKSHIEAVFQNVNPGTSDLISLDRYKIAMKTLGISCYNACPAERIPGYVDRETFFAEALSCLEKEFVTITTVQHS
nr:PREDICTED: uncharacterized protein LOC105662973 isoform X1 [Megachile rotundata]